MSLVLFSTAGSGQDTGSEKKVNVKIIHRSDGDTKIIEKTFSINEVSQLQELLNEYDLNMDADELLKDRCVEISIRKPGDDLDDKDVVVKIRQDKGRASKAFLGVFTEDADDADVSSGKARAGAVVVRVMENSPAEAAGLLKGDIITAVNDVEITGSRQFRETIGTFKSGEAITLTFVRDGKESRATATLSEMQDVYPPMFRDRDFGWKDGMPPMRFHHHGGMQERPFLGVVPDESMENQQGAVIGGIIEKSTAEAIGLKEGDVITAVNDRAVKNFDELRAAIRELKPGDDLKVKYLRDGKQGEASGKLKSKADTYGMNFRGDEIPPPCHHRWMHDFGDEWKDDAEKITKEGLSRKIEALERELQKLKDHLNRLDFSGARDDMQRKKEETTVTITIEDVSKSNLAVEKLTFSPNPSTGKFQLSFELPEKGKTTVRIFDVTNKEIYSEALGKFSGRYDRQIDVSQSPKGVYFLQITQDNKTLNKKIVIQ